MSPTEQEPHPHIHCLELLKTAHPNHIQLAEVSEYGPLHIPCRALWLPQPPQYVIVLLTLSRVTLVFQHGFFVMALT